MWCCCKPSCHCSTESFAAIGCKVGNITPKHDDIIKWKHFPHHWPLVRGIYQSPVNSPHKGQWCGALMFFWSVAEYKQLSKQWRRWWFEMPLHSLWRHCNCTSISYLLPQLSKNHNKVSWMTSGPVKANFEILQKKKKKIAELGHFSQPYASSFYIWTKQIWDRYLKSLNI